MSDGTVPVSPVQMHDIKLIASNFCETAWVRACTLLDHLPDTVDEHASGSQETKTARSNCRDSDCELDADGVVASLLLFQIFLLDCPMSVDCDPVVCRACLTVAASMGTGRAAADA